MGRADPSGRCAARWPRPLQARSADRRGGQSAPGCEPRSRRSRAEHRRLPASLRTPLAPHVADPPSLRPCRRGSSPSRRACRRLWHGGYRRRISQPGCGPLRRRLGARSHPDTERAPGRLAVGSCLLATACGCRPDRNTGDRQPTAGVPSAASAGRRCFASRPLTRSVRQPRPHDQDRCYQPPCSRLPGNGDRAAGVDFTLGR